MTYGPEVFDHDEEGVEIDIGGECFTVIGALRNFKVEDSFIHPKNKLLSYTGHGEAKKHVGNYKSRGEDLQTFFDYSQWGVPHADSQKQNRKTWQSAKLSGADISERCFVSKANLRKYLVDAREEFESHSSYYHNDISLAYKKHCRQVEELGVGPVWFSLYDASDSWEKQQDRGYIRSDDEVWKLIRKLLLPKISWLTILKLRRVEARSEGECFFFKVHFDYFNQEKGSRFESIPSLDEAVVETTKSTKSRRGQEQFKEEVLAMCPLCPFTMIADDRLLDAAHIKPYSVFPDDKVVDDIDQKGVEGSHFAQNVHNGLSLTPTYHRLFDRGLYTFDSKGRLVCSNVLSSRTWSQLGINPRERKEMITEMEAREEFMEYHRRVVFRDEWESVVES